MALVISVMANAENNLQHAKKSRNCIGISWPFDPL